MSWHFFIAVLAVWRVTHALAAEDGPFRIVARLRRRAGTGFWGELMDCFYCLSLWVATPFAILLGSSWPERVTLWLALSAAAILLNRLWDRVAPDRPGYFEGPPANQEECHELLWTSESAGERGVESACSRDSS
jgi:Protein of unknown function (DUF1360)